MKENTLQKQAICLWTIFEEPPARYSDGGAGMTWTHTHTISSEIPCANNSAVSNMVYEVKCMEQKLF